MEKDILLFLQRRMNFMHIIVTIIGTCAAAMLLWYVYILMKGDKQE